MRVEWIELSRGDRRGNDRRLVIPLAGCVVLPLSDEETLPSWTTQGQPLVRRHHGHLIASDIMSIGIMSGGRGISLAPCRLAPQQPEPSRGWLSCVIHPPGAPHRSPDHPCSDLIVPSHFSLVARLLNLQPAAFSTISLPIPAF